MMMGTILLLLLIPLSMIDHMVSERESRSLVVQNEIGKQWGNEQDVSGPYLMIPYLVSATKKTAAKDGVLVLMPEVLKVDATVDAVKRKRGIYETVLYRSDSDVQGVFVVPSIQRLKNLIPVNATIYFERTSLQMDIPHPRGIRKSSDLSWNGAKLEFRSGSKNGSPDAIHVPVFVSPGKEYRFQTALELNGNRHLTFTPAGKHTEIRMKSTWPSPSFFGSYLPDERTVGKDGFSAKWTISNLGRGFDQILVDPNLSLHGVVRSSGFGVKLIQPVDHYQKTERAIKYGLLFILLTYTAFFLFEIFQRTKIHPVQYLFIGIAMVLFYSLFLSFTEHLIFPVAYILSSVSTIGLITLYSVFVFRSVLRSSWLGVYLTGLYGFLYVVLQSEDYALLMGSTGLFVLLAIVMLATRNIDWYNLKMKSNHSAE